MQLRSISEWLRHAPLPGVGGFALLTGIEAVGRGILISVFPLAMYQALEDAALVSKVYFAVGILSIIMLVRGLSILCVNFISLSWNLIMICGVKIL